MIVFDTLLLIGSLLVLASIAIAKVSDRLGMPAMLLFLGIGMLAGSEGLGGIDFDDAALAQSIGIMALLIILFDGGLEMHWADARSVMWQAGSLATLGVALTTALVGAFAAVALKFSLLNGLLLGAIIASTDAAAVFSVFRSRNIGLRGRLLSLLELESGSNDPMAVFLTIGFIQLIMLPQVSIAHIITQFFVQMAFGAASGIVLGKVLVFTLNHLDLRYAGLYPVLSLAFAAFIYAATSKIGGSGFLAVYCAGIVAGNADVMHKKRLLGFFDGLAWLSQIAMFVTLGLLVFPSHIIPVVVDGLLISFFLMLIARPVAVFFSLLYARIDWREKLFVSWVGLRGSVPIILATFPLIAGVPEAHSMFNIVFFIVLTSALVQGWSVPLIARVLSVDTAAEGTVG